MNEVKLGVTLRVSDSVVGLDTFAAALSLDITGKYRIHGTAIASSTPADLSNESIDQSNALFIVRNAGDNDNDIIIDNQGAGGTISRLKPGQVAVIWNPADGLSYSTPSGFSLLEFFIVGITTP